MKMLGATWPAVALFVALVGVVTTAAGDVTGTWTVEVTYDNPSLSGGTISCAFRQEEARLNGSCDDIVTLTGEVKGSKVSFAIRSKDAAPWTTTFTGTLNDAGTAIAGTFQFTNERGRFRASKRSGAR